MPKNHTIEKNANFEEEIRVSIEEVNKRLL